MSILITNIKELVQVEEKPQLMVAGAAMSKLKSIQSAWLLIEGDRIRDFGTMPINNIVSYEADPSCTVIDATGKMVFPSFSSEAF